ncbi:MAG: helix-turn-helix domain-containing protein [Okeania sp. SIO3B5]|uniref:helix-turn-helix domain-containing protein n=1 Tax=Okeania sp. SIO3B5 TaxID=2607811 RepID=UPI001400C5B2|nr:helix-turn-helix domain-containing protein [Okeania sp. SIO3B5]NEO53297.1 helix-turn-helix domain-containing protein [Okeania sp. SIO3B5]
MTKAPLKSQQQQLMDRKPENIIQLFKDLLSDESDTYNRAKNKLSRWLWRHPKIGMVVKRSFSQTNFDDSNEFYDNSLQETFFKFDKIIPAFCRKNQITIDRLDDISNEKLGNLFIRYFNRSHYNTACDLYRKLKQKSQVNGQVIISLDQPKNDSDGQEYKTVGEEVPDHKNLNNLDSLNLGDMSQEAIDKLPISGGSIDKLRNCSKKVDCFEILLLKCQGYTQTKIAEKLGVHQSDISRNWQNKCLKCINKIIAENNIE